MRIKSKFTYMSLTLLVVTAVSVVWVLSYHSHELNAAWFKQEASSVLARNKAIQGYFLEELRPTLGAGIEGEKRLNAAEFIPQHAISRIESRTGEGRGNFLFKFASANPRNSRNLADEHELRFIAKLTEDPSLDRWSGVVEAEGVKWFLLMERGEEFTEWCLGCHGRPGEAPAAMLEEYGVEAGFNRKVGELSSVLSVRARMDDVSPAVETSLFEKSLFVVAALCLAIFLFWLEMRRSILNPVIGFMGRARKLMESEDEVTAETSGEVSELAGTVERLAERLVAEKKGYADLADRTYGELDRTETQLRRHKERYRRIHQMTPLAVVAWGADGLLTEWNERATELFGWLQEEVLGQDGLDLLVPGDERERIREAIESAVSGGVPTKVNAETLHRNGERIPCDWHLAPILDEKGGVEGMLALCLDITDQLGAEEEKETLLRQLHQAQKMEAVGTLAGGIAHDFNNILTAIMGYSELVIDDLDGNPQAKENQNKVLSAAERAMGLIDQLLDFSRSQSEEPRPIEARLVVKEALKLLRVSLPTTIEVVEEIGPDTGKVMADPGQIHQVLMNLCSNAHNAMKDTGGVVEVSLRRVEINSANKPSPDIDPGSYLELLVRDNGPGMNPDVAARVFEPFFTTLEIGKGSGMGLAVVHGIITKMGGAVTLETKLGEGTAFTVYLPSYMDEVEVKPEEIVIGQETQPTAAANILFVDDDVQLAALGVKLLNSLGYNVEMAGSGERALEMINSDSSRYDLVITDQTMPVMTGLELCEKMKEVAPQIPVIMCTGYSDVLTEEMAADIGAVGFLSKPFTRARLGEAVKRGLVAKS